MKGAFKVSPESLLIRLMRRLICSRLTGCCAREQSDKSARPHRRLAVRSCSTPRTCRTCEKPRRLGSGAKSSPVFAAPPFPPSCGLSRRCKARGGYYRGALIKAQHFDDFAAVSAAPTPPPCISAPPRCVCQGPSLIA